ncbi:MAG TPA: hypothetical protein VD948_02840 [Rhodothermales bacterium]|nr:hypothetical protein [Rhodothermales bacterium]
MADGRSPKAEARGHQLGADEGDIDMSDDPISSPVSEDAPDVPDLGEAEFEGDGGENVIEEALAESDAEAESAAPASQEQEQAPATEAVADSAPPPAPPPPAPVPDMQQTIAAAVAEAVRQAMAPMQEFVGLQRQQYEAQRQQVDPQSLEHQRYLALTTEQGRTQAMIAEGLDPADPDARLRFGSYVDAQLARYEAKLARQEAATLRQRFAALDQYTEQALAQQAMQERLAALAKPYNVEQTRLQKAHGMVAALVAQGVPEEQAIRDVFEFAGLTQPKPAAPKKAAPVGAPRPAQLHRRADQAVAASGHSNGRRAAAPKETMAQTNLRMVRAMWNLRNGS